MSDYTTCNFCGAEINAGREFIYQLESLQFCDDEAVLEWIRNSSTYQGEPLRLCRKCNDGVAKNIADTREEELHIALQTRWTQKWFVVAIFWVCVIYIVVVLLFSIQH
jgi:hypothetical protein